ncbi:MAG TPA: 3-(3-hydroxy-phenyl)propionate transporter MhpT [Steroidobacteraceae bacterium]|nr:3-(3-hydroxy-phenyl)propionate transporter MhpT [Steroidobacteraceae bacterium]
MIRVSKSGATITLLLCTAAAVFEGFDNQSMGVAAPRLAAEFALSSAQKGWIFSAAAFGLFFGAALGGRAADFYGRKRTLIVSLLLFGVFSILTALSIGPTSLFLARLLTGLGLGGAMPNFISLSSESVRSDRRLSAVTIVMAGMPFGGSIAALVALGEKIGWDWRSIFYVGGVGPIVVALIMIRALSESRGAGESASSSLTPARVASAWTSLFGDHRAPTTLLLWIAFFFTQLVLLLMLNWLPTLIVGLGFTTTQASWTSLCFNLSGSVGAILLGRLHAGAQRRVWAALTYIGMALALALIPAVGKTFLFAAIACGLAGVFIVGAQLILFALAPLYYDYSIRGTGVGASVAVGRLGSIVGPLFASALLAGGGNSATVLIGILPFVIVSGAAAFALTWRKQSD